MADQAELVIGADVSRKSPVPFGAPLLNGRARTPTAPALVSGPLVMTVGFFASYLAWRGVPAGARDVDVTDVNAVAAEDAAEAREGVHTVRL
ncbi:MAG: hypothetical protein WCP28_15065 [Actinomycetes bacterium]